MKACPSCSAQVAPQVQLCPFCAFSFVTGEKRVVSDPGPNAVRCAACSSLVTKGMRCIKCGLPAPGESIALRVITIGVVVSVVIVLVVLAIATQR